MEYVAAILIGIYAFLVLAQLAKISTMLELLAGFYIRWEMEQQKDKEASSSK